MKIAYFFTRTKSDLNSFFTLKEKEISQISDEKFLKNKETCDRCLVRFFFELKKDIDFNCFVALWGHLKTVYIMANSNLNSHWSMFSIGL